MSYMAKYFKTAVFVLCFITGLVLIWNCVDYGKSFAHEILMQNGGSMDTNTYLIYIQKAIDKYRTAGSVLAAFGGMGIIVNTTVFKIKS